MKTHFRAKLQKGYTLIEVLVAAAVVSVGMAAMISLSSSMVLQEDLAWRTAIIRNYQENMARLWQLGLSPFEVNKVMPDIAHSRNLRETIFGEPSIIVIAPNPVDIAGLGKMQRAEIRATVNISADLEATVEGSAYTLTAYRPYLPETLRTMRAR